MSEQRVKTVAEGLAKYPMKGKLPSYKVIVCGSCGHIFRECDLENIRVQEGRINCPVEVSQPELWADTCPECGQYDCFEDAEALNAGGVV